METAMDGKLDVGNPHVEFDERDVTSAASGASFCNGNQPTKESKLKAGSDNIVKSILYACTISCMVGPMAEMLKEPAGHVFQLTVGFLWFLFYSAYLLDEVYSRMEYGEKSPCKGLDLFGWMLFMIQGCVIRYSGNVSICMGCLGLMVINLSLHKYKEGKDGEKQRRCERWMAENIVMLVFMVTLLICHWVYGCCSWSEWFAMIKSYLSFRYFMTGAIIGMGIVGFLLKTHIMSWRNFVLMAKIPFQHFIHPVETIKKCFQKEAI